MLLLSLFTSYILYITYYSLLACAIILTWHKSFIAHLTWYQSEGSVSEVFAILSSSVLFHYRYAAYKITAMMDKPMFTWFSRSQVAFSNPSKSIVIKTSTRLYTSPYFLEIKSTHLTRFVPPSLSWPVSEPPIKSLNIPSERSCPDLSNPDDFTLIEPLTRLQKFRVFVSMRRIEFAPQVFTMCHHLATPCQPTTSLFVIDHHVMWHVIGCTFDCHASHWLWPNRWP